VSLRNRADYFVEQRAPVARPVYDGGCSELFGSCRKDDAVFNSRLSGDIQCEKVRAAGSRANKGTYFFTDKESLKTDANSAHLRKGKAWLCRRHRINSTTGQGCYGGELASRNGSHQ
jgi:hypothetical protein